MLVVRASAVRASVVLPRWADRRAQPAGPRQLVLAEPRGTRARAEPVEIRVAAGPVASLGPLVRAAAAASRERPARVVAAVSRERSARAVAVALLVRAGAAGSPAQPERAALPDTGLTELPSELHIQSARAAPLQLPPARGRFT